MSDAENLTCSTQAEQKESNIKKCTFNSVLILINKYFVLQKMLECIIYLLKKKKKIRATISYLDYYFYIYIKGALKAFCN